MDRAQTAAVSEADVDEPAHVVEVDQECAVVELIAGHRLEAAWHVSAMTGMRRGEVLGLRWADVDLDAARIHVRHPLSNLVRYRPSDGEKLLGSPRGWLFSSWVDRAAETFLLNMASRITGEDHIMG